MKPIHYLCILACVLPQQRAFAQLQSPIIPPTQQPVPDSVTPARPLPRLEEIDPLALPSGLEQTDLDPNLTVMIQSITFTGNTEIADETIDQALLKFIGKTLSVSELNEIETSITELYRKQGFIGSGAIIFDQSESFDAQNAVIKLQIIEKKVSKITIVAESKESERVKPYIRRNLASLKGDILNESVLSNKLRFILDRPSIRNIQVAIEPTEFLDEADLRVEIESDEVFSAIATLNDQRSPQTGSIERGVSLVHRNVSGLGDQVQINYRNTDGTNLVGLSYQVPVNAADGTINLDYLFGDSSVVEEELDELDLRSVSHNIALSFRQPILRQSSNSKIQEFAIGIGVERFDNTDTISDIPFPLSDSAEDNGITRSTIIKIFQDFFSRTESDVATLGMELSYGLPLGSANDDFFGEGEFLKFALNGQYTRRLSDRLASSTRLSGQIADRDLISDQNFFLGGDRSVRGFRPNAIARNNGLSLSQEFQIGVFDQGRHRLEVAPFFDFGVASNLSEQLFEETEILASAGIALRYRLANRLFLSFEFGQPILGDRNSRGSQINFDIQWRVF